MADKDFLMMESSSNFDIDFISDGMEFDELDCSNPLAMSGRCALHNGIRIEISKHSQSMRQVANITIALHRLKHSTVQSTEFTDHELLNIFLENVVEESVQMGVFSNPPGSYTKYGKVMQCTICDKLQKSLVRSKGAPILQAVTLKGGSISQSISINLSSYIPQSIRIQDSQPVCLGIANSNLYLSCTNMNMSETPTLSIEEVTDRTRLKMIHEKDDMERFLFLRKGTGVSINTFESVKYPGWFISTSQNDTEPVDMCYQKKADRITAFTLRDLKETTED